MWFLCWAAMAMAEPDEREPEIESFEPAASGSVDLTPRLEPAPGIVYDTDVHYRMGYRPRTRNLVWGAVGMAAGMAVVGGTWHVYHDQGMVEQRRGSQGLRNLLVAGNTLGWTGAALGGVSFAVGFAPSSDGPVVAIPKGAQP